MRFNGLPSGHTNLNDGHPGLNENLFERTLVTKVSSTSLKPEMIEEETTENVQGLPRVGEAASVVSKEPGGVIFLLGDSLPEKDERPGDGDVLRHFPFVPNFL